MNKIVKSGAEVNESVPFDHIMAKESEKVEFKNRNLLECHLLVVIRFLGF